MVTRILAWDYSGSTNRVTHYFNVGKTYFEEFQAVEKDKSVTLIYLLWGTECIKVTNDELKNIIQKRRGVGGCTYPSEIIHWIQKNVPAGNELELWLLTDGDIDREELAKCSNLNESMTYSLIKFIIINTSPSSSANMSVGASFISGSQVEIFINHTIFKSINTADPFNYDSIDIHNFESTSAELLDFIQAKFMGSDREALEECEKLNALRKRLLTSLVDTNKSIKMSKKNETLFTSKKKGDLIRDLKECQFYKTLTNAETKNKRSEIDGVISSIVNYIHNKQKSFDFNGLKMDFKNSGMPPALGSAEDEPEIENLGDVEECKFYDCVTMEEEFQQPILLLPITDLISKYWENGSYAKFRSIVDCPFFASIDSCIGHIYSLDTFKALREHSEDSGERLINPMTNEPIFGGLIFSTNGEADAWNDFVLAHTFFRGKKVCPDLSLWYFMIWKHCIGKNWIVEEVVEKLKRYVFQRLETAKVRIGFSSLPLDPQERVGISIACFYCTEGSSILFGEDRDLFTHERLRKFFSIAEYMLEILRYFGYTDVNEEFVRERANTFKMVAQLKRIPQTVEKRFRILQEIFKTTEDGRFLTYEVKDKKAMRYLQSMEYDHKEMIPFYSSSTSVELNAHVVVGYEYKALYDVELCRATYRPYFVVFEENAAKVANYKQILECITYVRIGSDTSLQFIKNVKRLHQTRLISTAKQYINFTNTFKRYPTMEEYKDYVGKVMRLKENNLIFLFQPNIGELLEETFKLYSKVDAGVDEFLRAADGSASVESRVNLEERIEDTELEKFLLGARQLLYK